MALKNFNLILLILLIFSSCQSEEKKQAEHITKSKNFDNKNKKLTVRNDPEKYTEEITDTVIHTDNNYRIVIKKYTLMNSYVILDLEDQELHVRDRGVDIKFYKSGSLIKSVTYKKQDFSTQFEKGFEEKAIILGCWFDSFDKQQRELIINLSICAEDTDWCYLYKIYIDEKGNVRYELEEVT